jgi:carbon-monoxide dehydrogenase catalytic subunit
MAKEAISNKDKAWDPASIEILEKAQRDCVDTCFSRMETQSNQCKFGTSGVCCRICHMGPCRITPKSPKGVCGADADTIAARNLLREIVGGTAAHSDHGRHLVLRLKKVAQGKGGDYKITDEKALRRAAKLYDIEEAGRTKEAVALDVAEMFLNEFASQEETLKTLLLAPEQQQKTWEKYGIKPEGVDRMCVESMHRTHMGVDHDYRNLLLQGFRTSLADGWGGARVATMVSDILFGTPTPHEVNVDMGIMDPDYVNIAFNGHQPWIGVAALQKAGRPEYQEMARQAGAKGIHIVGSIETGQELLQRACDRKDDEACRLVKLAEGGAAGSAAGSDAGSASSSPGSGAGASGPGSAH